MCGRFNLIDSPDVRALCAMLGIDIGDLRFSKDISPASLISIVREVNGQRIVSDAIWWLMLDPHTSKPSKYTSFNSRWDKLNAPKSISYHPYRKSRCIIPASAFIEGLGDGRTYHKIELDGRAIAFGGIYREYLNTETGEVMIGASIITLAPLRQWRDIHPKSMPLMLPTDQHDVINAWLDPAVTDVEQFESLLQPRVRAAQVITPIDRPSKWNPVAPPFNIPPR